MFSLRPYQAEAKQAILNAWDEGQQKTLLVLPTGCHTPGQKILMATGETKTAESICVGDRLMGSDGTPRTVLHITTGEDALYTIVPKKGDPFTVTGDHQLTLVRSGCTPPEEAAELIDVKVTDWLTWSPTKKNLYKLVRASAIDSFEGRDSSSITVDPYFLGVLLGDGCLLRGVSVCTMEPEIREMLYEQAEEYGYRIRAVAAGRANNYYLSGIAAGRLRKEGWRRRRRR